MRPLSDLREDMRLARLNNPAYGFLFKILDIAKVLAKLLILAAFGLGIWHIIYDLGSSDSSNRAKQYAKALNQSNDTAVAGVTATTEPDVGALTPERIEMLRQFATENRHTIADRPIDDGADNSDSLITRNGESMISKVQMPEVIVDQSLAVVSDDPAPEIIVGGDLVPLPVEQTLPVISIPLDLKSSGAFNTLESELRKPLELAGDVIEIAEPSVITQIVEAGEEGNISVEDNGGINSDAWILAQNSDRYIIQIGSTSNRPFLVRFAQLLPKGEPVSIYYYVFRDRPEYGLSYGLFDSKAEANAALEKLSQKVRRYGAFARKLSIVHQQVNKLADRVSVARQ